MKRLFWLSISGASFVGFVFFTYLVKKDLFRQLDFNIAVKIKDNVPLRLDPLFSLASTVGSVFIISLVLIAVIWKMPLRNKLITLFLYFGAQGLEYFLKMRLRQPGPPFQFQRHFTQTYFDKDYVQQGYSYPSGHSFRAIFIALLIIYFAVKKWGITLRSIVIGGVAAAGAATIMIGKMVLGAHWLTDIIGGSILAISMVGIVISLIPSSDQHDQVVTHERQNKSPQQ
ncbi:phosphatase PAP2 family protein [Candidatus Microgenomates bacterium]|nr:phosphatase PAP2 family protein [Candidatus Microgenomates bacterium]